MELDAEHRQKNEASEMEMLRLGEEKSKWICKSIARGQSKWIGRCTAYMNWDLKNAYVNGD
ncbi:unnamed protein product [Prunus armeniaca]